MRVQSLLPCAHLRKGQAQFRYQEDRVVSETPLPARAADDHTGAPPFRLSQDPALWIRHR